MEQSAIPGFRFVPRTGVIYVMHEAAQHGFSYDDPAWANLGQGSPETGPLPDAPARVESLTIPATSQQYGPVAGNKDLRQAVADFYNITYRRDKKSKYTPDNVSIASGGRLALTRLASALGNVNMGHFIPDYTAYEELLSVFKAFTAIPILLDAEAGYKIPLPALKKEILGRGLSALLVSNPCNPTGQLVEDGELRAWCALARECHCSLIIDEFYSHYIYGAAKDEPAKMVSAAAYVDDVEADPVIIVDGLTKNWRYPGWRISWTLGPKAVIETIASAGSFLDGGANHPFQSVVAKLLDPQLAIQETAAIQKHFAVKRDYVMGRLKKMGITMDAEPAGAFYIWANLSHLPKPLNDGMSFFREGLKEKVIIVPGEFFDVNPGNRRVHGRYGNYCRISFGPEMKKLEIGLDALDRVVKKFIR
ncbi:pyridoxal phosphate-dependent aminotransferase [Pedosphaera parvula]|uniref:Aminotransferase class I and II n=1 Tax=Pedosphaera parvula (strain Ellin514) TaxID=320771 RepID=B9XQH5_PEDPL|nr:pyridoxal phosphate-dependent aminotransferase [Pedosphaera parvula]EEF57900.1 aminotransferase class I and II [Pedosphaera parvula Ellin514]